MDGISSVKGVLFSRLAFSATMNPYDDGSPILQRAGILKRRILGARRRVAKLTKLADRKDHHP